MVFFHVSTFILQLHIIANQLLFFYCLGSSFY